MKKVGLNITPKEFKQLSKWAENIYNTAVVIDYFVANQPLVLLMHEFREHFDLQF